MPNTFPELKSQEELNRYEFGFQFFKWYMIIGIGINILFYGLLIAAMIKYLMS